MSKQENKEEKTELKDTLPEKILEGKEKEKGIKINGKKDGEKKPGFDEILEGKEGLKEEVREPTIDGNTNGEDIMKKERLLQGEMKQVKSQIDRLYDENKKLFDPEEWKQHLSSLKNVDKEIKGIKDKLKIVEKNFRKYSRSIENQKKRETLAMALEKLSIEIATKKEQVHLKKQQKIEQTTEEANLKKEIESFSKTIPFHSAVDFDNAARKLARSISKEKQESKKRALEDSLQKLESSREKLSDYLSLLGKSVAVRNELKDLETVIEKFQIQLQTLTSQTKNLQSQMNGIGPISEIHEVSDLKEEKAELLSILKDLNERKASLKEEWNSKHPSEFQQQRLNLKEIANLKKKKDSLQRKLSAISTNFQRKNIPFHPQLYSWIIGKRGARINSLRKSTGANIQVSKYTNTIEVKGVEQIVSKAVQQITTMIQSQEKQHIKEIRFSPSEYSKMKKFASLRKDLNCDVKIDRIEGVLRLRGEESAVLEAEKSYVAFCTKDKEAKKRLQEEEAQKRQRRRGKDETKKRRQRKDKGDEAKTRQRDRLQEEETTGTGGKEETK